MFLKISQIQRKIPVLKSPFDKVAVCNFIKKQWWCFPVKFMKFLRTSICRTPMDNCFCQKKRSSAYLQDFCCKNFARPRHSCMPENFGKFQNTAGRLFLHVTAQKMKTSFFVQCVWLAKEQKHRFFSATKISVNTDFFKRTPSFWPCFFAKNGSCR